MGKDWIKKQLKDPYYKGAQKDRLRSRAAYKLRQIDSKFDILNGAKLVLDLCCAPGSWIEEVKRKLKDISIVGVDLAKMTPIEGVVFVQGDITNDEVISKLDDLLKGEIDVILSDCAPKLTGSKETDQARQLFIIEHVFKITAKYLKAGGHLVCKLFDGPHLPHLKASVSVQFKRVKYFKPEASRKLSAELYLIGIGFKKSIS